MAELRQLGRYQLRRILGQGSMGVVYEGFDPTLNRRVAVKTILKSHHLDPGTAKDYSKRFVREAHAAARLNHPNIVQIHDFGEDDEVAYLVMEYILGRELKSFFEGEERFAQEESVRIMCELLDALDFAHEAGVIHRDVKPANVILDTQRRVKLADFGVARIEDSIDRSQAGTMVGTPAYMSPEQITGATVDRRTDVFSAGVIFYELLTGKRPFTGSGAWTLARMIVQENPPLPSTLDFSVSSAFDVVVNEALAKRPENRFARANDFAVALRRAQGTSQAGASEVLSRPAETSLPPSAPQAPAPERSAVHGNQKIEMELEFWRSIKDNNDAQELELFLKKFPDSTYAELAHLKLQKLRYIAAANAKEERKEPAFSGDAVVVDPPHPSAARVGPAQKRGTPAVVGLIALAVAAIGGGVWFALSGNESNTRTLPSKQAAQTAPVVDPKQVERQAQEKAAAEQKAQAERVAAEQSAAAEKAAQEARLAEDRAAQEKEAEATKATEKAQAEKFAAEKAAKTAVKTAKERAAFEIAQLERFAAEKLAAERGAALKADAERLAAEKAAAENARQAARSAVVANQAGQGRLQPCSALPGTATWTNCFAEFSVSGGAKYAGEFRDGNFGGQGTYTFAGGAKYAGEFRDGKYNGQGSYTLPSGEKYVGEFRDGTYNGRGSYTLPSGERYVGEFRNGMYSGQGTTTFSSGERYVGEFRAGKRNGHGNVTFPNGEKYIGEFRDGAYSGQGTYAFPNGAKWVGEWRNDKRNGHGIEYRTDGTVLRTGFWENGVFARGP